MSEPNLLLLLLVSNALLLALTAIVLVRVRQRMRRFEDFWHSPTGAALLEVKPPQIRVVEKPSEALERRVAELQCVMRTLVKQETRGKAPAETGLPIENAVRMAQHGASIDDLIRSCGLNIGEAKLMHKLHGMQRTATH